MKKICMDSWKIIRLKIILFVIDAYNGSAKQKTLLLQNTVFTTIIRIAMDDYKLIEQKESVNLTYRFFKTFYGIII